MIVKIMVPHPWRKKCFDSFAEPPLNKVLFSSEFKIKEVIKRLIYNDDPLYWRQNFWLTRRQNDVLQVCTQKNCPLVNVCSNIWTVDTRLSDVVDLLDFKFRTKKQSFVHADQEDKAIFSSSKAC